MNVISVEVAARNAKISKLEIGDVIKFKRVEHLLDQDDYMADVSYDKEYTIVSHDWDGAPLFIDDAGDLDGAADYDIGNFDIVHKA